MQKTANDNFVVRGEAVCKAEGVLLQQLKCVYAVTNGLVTYNSIVSWFVESYCIIGHVHISDIIRVYKWANITVGSIFLFHAAIAKRCSCSDHLCSKVGNLIWKHVLHEKQFFVEKRMLKGFKRIAHGAPHVMLINWIQNDCCCARIFI